MSQVLIGEKIKKLREQQNLPLRKVAAYLDIDTSLLSKIERGERPLNSMLITKIAEFFNLDHSGLMVEFYGEEIAKKIYKEPDYSEIFQVAEKKAEYFKSISKK